LFLLVQSWLIGAKKNGDGSVSTAMISLAEEATQVGLNEIEDVETVLNAFKYMSWCLRAISIFVHQPSSADVVALVNQESTIDIRDAKTLIRAMKSMANRATSWESKVLKAE